MPIIVHAGDEPRRATSSHRRIRTSAETVGSAQHEQPRQHARTPARARSRRARPRRGTRPRTRPRPGWPGSRARSARAAGWPGAPSPSTAAPGPPPASRPGRISGRSTVSARRSRRRAEQPGRLADARAARRRPPPRWTASPARRSGRRRRRSAAASSGRAGRTCGTFSAQNARLSAMTRPGTAKPPRTAAVDRPALSRLR